MHIRFFISLISTFILALLGMAFFTLLERKALAYFQLRKGPNKVSISGVPQPFADAIKLFTKEQAPPHSSNKIPFFATPIISLRLALLL
jgi:NADH-ubiquinone oxidoreductase chain 1